MRLPERYATLVHHSHQITAHILEQLSTLLIVDLGLGREPCRRGGLLILGTSYWQKVIAKSTKNLKFS